MRRREGEKKEREREKGKERGREIYRFSNFPTSMTSEVYLFDDSINKHLNMLKKIIIIIINISLKSSGFHMYVYRKWINCSIFIQCNIKQIWNRICNNRDKP